MKTTLGSQLNSILDFGRDMDRVAKMIKQVTPDEVEEVKSLARALGCTSMDGESSEMDNCKDI